MLHNLPLLSHEELQQLFLKEIERFTEGMDHGRGFLYLKQIRLNLREIAVEMKKRKELNPDGQSNGY